MGIKPGPHHARPSTNIVPPHPLQMQVLLDDAQAFMPHPPFHLLNGNASPQERPSSLPDVSLTSTPSDSMNPNPRVATTGGVASCSRREREAARYHMPLHPKRTSGGIARRFWLGSTPPQANSDWLANNRWPLAVSCQHCVEQQGGQLPLPPCKHAIVLLPNVRTFCTRQGRPGP